MRPGDTIWTGVKNVSFPKVNRGLDCPWRRRASAGGGGSRQTQNICITFVHCRTSVEDVGPTLYKCSTNVLCLLGCKGGIFM